MPTIKGTKLSQAHREKLSLAKKGKIPKNISLIAGWNRGKSSWSKGKHLSEEHKRKIGESNKKVYSDISRRQEISNRFKGEKNKWWKGGLTEKNHSERVAIMNSWEYRFWRESVFKRDNYTCVWCHLKAGLGKSVILNADHIKPFASYPELRLVLENGRTLCVPCHKKTNTWGRPKKESIPCETIKLLSDLY